MDHPSAIVADSVVFKRSLQRAKNVAKLMKVAVFLRHILPEPSRSPDLLYFVPFQTTLKTQDLADFWYSYSSGHMQTVC